MKFIIKNLLFLLVTHGSLIVCKTRNDFNQKWLSMQDQYKKLNAEMLKIDLAEHKSKYCIPFWEQKTEAIKQLILGPANKNFLSHEAIRSTMVRFGWTSSQDYEVYFLENCLSPETQKIMTRLSDTQFSGLPFECQKFNCSTNTLVHWYYVARTLEVLRNQQIKSVIEFGGGYGNLARTFKMAEPEATFVIIDLPELLAIQYLFLSSTLPETTKIIVHSQPTNSLETGAIHLIPSYIVEKCDLKSDIFISTFALSESSKDCQNVIANKNFFNSRLSYIVGQLEGWHDLNLTHHSFVHKAIRNQYKTVICEPSYLFFLKVPAYEIFGMNMKESHE